MAIENFKPEVLESALIEAYREVSIVDQITMKPSRVEGKLARFNVLAAGQIKDYVGTVEADEIVTTAIDLVYNKKKYYAVALDDADSAMLQADVLMPMADQLAYQLKKVIEADVFAEAVLGAKSKVTPSADIYADIVDAGVKLDENNVPAGGRFVIMRPADVSKLAKDDRVIAHHGNAVLANGIVEGMNVNGMQVVKCNNVPEGKIVVMHKDAVGFGQLLEKTEAIRGEHAFEDIVRGLAVYGCKTLRAEGIAVIGA